MCFEWLGSRRDRRIDRRLLEAVERVAVLAAQRQQVGEAGAGDQGDDREGGDEDREPGRRVAPPARGDAAVAVYSASSTRRRLAPTSSSSNEGSKLIRALN